MATQRPVTPSAAYGVPSPHDPAHLSRGYGAGAGSHLDNVDASDFGATPANPVEASPLSQSLQRNPSQRMGRFEESFDARSRGQSVLDEDDMVQRSASRASTLNQGGAPSRSGTLKKKGSVKRSGSLKRSGSRRSTHAGSIRGVTIDDAEKHDRHDSVFYTPVPTSGSPTEILANRFQAWRKFLKDLITYFREVAGSFEHRAKSLLKVSNVINNTNAPSIFMTEGGLNDANRILRDFHKQSVSEANKARDIESEVINQLSGLRSDLGQKIKEIKSLSGDFKNTVEKEKEATRKCVAQLEEALAIVDADPSAAAGKGDPYVVKLGVDRQVERQIDEENYLHRAYLNLENSGRELESIVVGEIQKAYNALANILKRDADESYSTIEKLRSGPVGMPRDFEWNNFVTKDPHFVNPNMPLRRLEEIEYPGRHHPATTEVRAGMLERKSKYLKSYTPGWYVLSPTHLHEFKSADRIYTQPPVMSLYLPDQKLGSHSQPGSSSHKFVLKGRQTGSMHRGHTWVFRAETYDTMLAWYEDVKTLTEKTGEERDAFVRRHHARSLSQGSVHSTSSDGGLEEDEADEVPYSANQSMANAPLRAETPQPQRPSPGGRFPSDMQMDRSLQAPLSPSSGSSEVGHDLTTTSGGLQPGVTYHYPTEPASFVPVQSAQQPDATHPASQIVNAYQNDAEDNSTQFSYSNPPLAQKYQSAQMPAQSSYQPRSTHESTAGQPASALAPSGDVAPHNSNYGGWLAPAAGGATAGALGTAAYDHHRNKNVPAGETASTKYAQAGSTPISTSVAVQSEPDSLATTPAMTADNPFLDGTEAVPTTASTKVVNGGPVGGGFPIHPRRTNTDFSVSELYIPGEYPKP